MSEADLKVAGASLDGLASLAPSDSIMDGATGAGGLAAGVVRSSNLVLRCAAGEQRLA